MNRQVHSQRILIVDDEKLNIGLLERILRRAGYTEISTTSDSRQVLSRFKAFAPDILLLDLNMPHLDGFAITEVVRDWTPEGAFLPILVISGDEGARLQALTVGANDFIGKPYDAAEVVLRVKNLLKIRDLHMRLDELVRERKEKQKLAEVEVAERLALVAELRDYRGGAHTQRVGELSARIAGVLGLSAEEVELIRRAAPLHDIGKLAIPDAILLKEGPLTIEELDQVKAHTTVGARMLSGSSSQILQLAEEIALYHHEHWDGTGYTPGVEGEGIPLAARIVAVADVFDALTHLRPYKKAWPVEDAVDWIKEESGKRFDPQVVEAFLGALKGGGLRLLRAEPEEEWKGLVEAIQTELAVLEEPREKRARHRTKKQPRIRSEVGPR